MSHWNWSGIFTLAFLLSFFPLAPLAERVIRAYIQYRNRRLLARQIRGVK